MTERRDTPVEINAGRWVNALAFSPNGEYLWSGDDESVRGWRVEDGKQMASMGARYVHCLAVSKDGRYRIAAGTFRGEVIVWDAETHRQVFSYKDDHYSVIHGVDFSPDSTQLVTASSNGKATIWDIATHEQVVGPLHHEKWVTVAKYSPQGDRIATASPNSVRVYNSNNGHLLVTIPVEVTPYYNTGLLWANDHLWVGSDSRIKRFEASTGSIISESPVPDSNYFSCIALPQNGEFITYSASCTVTFWDTSTHNPLGLIQHAEDIGPIAPSPDGRFLAIVGGEEKITIRHLSHIIEPDIQIGDAALDLWKRGQLANAEALLAASISESRDASHHVLACRALVRSRLRQWDAAIVDAEKSIKIRPSVIGLIAKSVALIGKGKKHEGIRACDIAFEYSYSGHISFLLLMKAVIVFMTGEYDDAISRMDDLIATVRLNLAYMYYLLGNSHMENGDYEGAIQLYERVLAQTQHHTSPAFLVVSLITGWRFDNLGFMIRQCLCEAQYAVGRTKEGGDSFLKMVKTFDEEDYMNEHITKWVSDFTQRCLSTPGNAAPKAARHDKVQTHHATLNLPIPTLLLKEWVKVTLARSEWKDALVAAVSFMIPRFTVYRAICEHLDTIDGMTGASECFRQMLDELAEPTEAHDEQAEWILDFKYRCIGKLEGLGDAAMGAERHDDAISQYSAALSLDPAVPRLYIKRSKAFIARDSWEDALNDANKVITLDPLSPWGYEGRHAALHKAGDYENAIDALEAMLLKISQLHDPAIREHHHQYVNPGETKVTIRGVVQDTIRDSPRMLINTISGRLLNKTEQSAMFESLPVFKELISSMVTHVDHARIEQEVTQYYRYATFSHKWEEDEPLFEKILRIVVYDLEPSLTHDKLQVFCKIVRHAGLHWAWSDTCCINKSDHFVLQEALVAMFKWYQGSAVTMVLLRGVRSPSQRGDLVRSIWNTRAWTFQEYHASRVVRFYNEDWTLYMNLDVPNHKESPEIISEMEEATGVSSRVLMALRPGSDDIREKLCLASRRQTTLIEDAAYSSLGIFSVSLPVVYGEGDKALGRLLGQLLTSSGDTRILAWTGRSGSFNSCLPTFIKAYSELPTSHIPAAIGIAKMDAITTGLRASPLNLTSVTKLYDRLNELPVPSFAGRRMRLPCIIFKLGALSTSLSVHVFRAQTAALGIVEIGTKEDLSRLDSLYLIHPWIDFLLDRQPVGSVTETIPEDTDEQFSSIGHLPLFPGPFNITPAAPQTQPAWRMTRLGRRRPSPRDAPSLRPPSSVSRTDKQTRALQLLARLNQPFGALLLTPDLGNVAAYRRVAAESLITVQVEEITPTILNRLVDSVCILDVL